MYLLKDLDTVYEDEDVVVFRPVHGIPVLPWVWPQRDADLGYWPLFSSTASEPGVSCGGCSLLDNSLFVLLTMTSVSMTPEIIPRVIIVTVGMFLVTLAPAAAFQPFISVDQEVRIIWDQTKTITRWLDTSQAPAQHQHFSIIQNYGVSSENTENVRLRSMYVI